MSDRTKYKDKIEKLLRLAESSSVHEAELATKKAEALMVQWGIDEAELWANKKVDEDIVEVHRVYSANSRGWVPFANAICNGMGGLRVLRMKLGGSAVRLYVIGHKSDVERAGMLLDSLEMQADRALAVWWSSYATKEFIPKSQWYKSKHQFLWSFGMEVGRRLREQRESQVANRAPGTGLVLVSREQKVSDWMVQNHNVKKGRNYQGTHHGSDAGRAAGSRATLGERQLR